MNKTLMCRGAALAAAALLVAGAAGAAPSFPPSTVTYYNDAGEAVGWRLTRCSGDTGLFGRSTDNYTIDYLSCR